MTADQPKGMVEVAGKPILGHVFRTLVDAGVGELVVIVGYEKKAILSHFGDEFDSVPITYAHQQEPEGLAAAILEAEPYIEDQFAVLNGDNVFVDGIDEVVERASDQDLDAALLVKSATLEEAQETGVVETDNGQVTQVVEKPAEPTSRLVTTGCYVLSPEIFDAIRSLSPSERGEYELSDAVNLLVQAGARVEAVQFEGQRVNVNTPADIETAEQLLRSQ